MTILSKKKSLGGAHHAGPSATALVVASAANAPADAAEAPVPSVATVVQSSSSVVGSAEGASLVGGRRCSATMDMMLDAEPMTAGRKRQAALPLGRVVERTLIRNKQRNAGHLLASTSAEATAVEAYNSEDELSETNTVESAEAEREFEAALKAAKGFVIKKMEADGACMFRAVADQVYGDQEMHKTVRAACISYMKKNSDYFSQFVTENFSNYLSRKSNEAAHGNHVELQAMAELYNRPIEVYQYKTTPMNTFFCDTSSNLPPIRLSYHRSSHYNSVVDPYNATIGVGLGMPQFYPGMADRMLMQDASMVSERDAIEEAMLKDKLMATDWEATDAQLQEQAACESYLQWLADQKRRGEQTTSGAATSSIAHGSVPSSSSSYSAEREQSSGVALLPWASEDDLISHVMALSSQEYIDSLKKGSKQQADEAACCSKSQTDQPGCSTSTAFGAGSSSGGNED